MISHCEHVKANGHFCGSPAMRGRNYCFFHLSHIGQRLRLERYAAHGLQSPPIELPLLEDAASIQLALMQVTEALLHGTLDPKRGGLVLYALQTASSNLRNMAKDAKQEDTVAVCNRYDSFEQDYELDEKSTANLRVPEPPEEDNSAAVVASEEQPSDAAPASEDGSGAPATAPRRQRPLRIHDEDFQLPIMLSEEQYLQARAAIFQYRLDHDIDANDVQNKVIPQRAAISQKIFLGTRRPPQSVRMEEERESLAEASV